MNKKIFKQDIDEFFIKSAIKYAEAAMENGDVPVGAVIVRNGEILCSAYNRREADGSATSHAELLCIEQASRILGRWRLSDCTLYCTLEPCVMCGGAIVNSRIKRVVFGAYDSRFGALGSVINLNFYPLNHKPEVIGGVCEEECRELLRNFFAEKRK